MKSTVKITDIQTVNELSDYWNQQNYIELLKEYDFPDGAGKDEIKDLLFMAITDFEPAEAASILLKYKLSESLNEGQIANISHEMLKDRIAEEYPDPSLHFALFNINQLLHKAYNGKFPNTLATIIVAEILVTEDSKKISVTKEIVIKSLSAGLNDSNLVNRLFKSQISGEEVFSDAENTIWSIKEIEPSKFQIITSNYWISKEDFAELEFETKLNFAEEEA